MARRAAFPGDRLVFEMAPGPGCREAEIEWSGGGEPAAGKGRRFATTFTADGNFSVSARCGASTVEFPVAVCEVDAWLLRAATFFGSAIRLSEVGVRSSRWVLGPSGTGWTCNDVVRFKRPAREQDLPSEATFIHELTHVWEHQTGQAQLLKGSLEQTGRLFGRDPYDYGGPDGVRSARELTDFSKESQAQIVMELWRSQHGVAADTRGVSFDTPGYREDLRRLAEGAGIGTRPSTRRTVAGAIDGLVARVVNAVLGLAE